MLVDRKSASIRSKKVWLPCWSLYNEQVSHHRWIEGSHSKKACKGLTVALKPRADISRSPKQEYQWPNICPPKIIYGKKMVHVSIKIWFEFNQVKVEISWKIIWNPEQTSAEVQNRSISGPTYVHQKLFMEKRWYMYPLKFGLNLIK